MELKYLIPLIPFAVSAYCAYKWWILHDDIVKMSDREIAGEDTLYQDNHVTYDLLLRQREGRALTWFGILAITILLVTLL